MKLIYTMLCVFHLEKAMQNDIRRIFWLLQMILSDYSG
jgi:hypothetical protein